LVDINTRSKNLYRERRGQSSNTLQKLRVV